MSFGDRDIYRALEAIRVSNELAEQDGEFNGKEYMWYPETEFYYQRNKKAFFAAKGGYNDESHNHNDAGTFSLWVNNTPVMIDAGVGTYTRQTFSGERYSIWTMQSNYHNLPMINGVPEKYGKNFKATDVKALRNNFSTNIATAYPEEAGVKEWVRSYSLKSNELVIKDKFKLKEAKEENIINFLTWGNVTVNRDNVTIDVNGVKAQLKFDNGKFDVKKETVVLTDKRLSDVWGSKVYRLSFTAKEKSFNGNYSFTIKY